MKDNMPKWLKYMYMFIGLSLLLNNLHPESLWDHITRGCGAACTFLFGYEIIKTWFLSKRQS